MGDHSVDIFEEANEEEEVPEILRLESFIKSLEDQLNANDINLFKDVPTIPTFLSKDSGDLESEEDEELELSPLATEVFFEEFERVPTQDLLSPFDDLSFDSDIKNPVSAFKTPLPDPNKPPFPFGENTISVLKTPSSRLDEFLLALQRAGYGNVDMPGESSSNKMNRFGDRTYNYFFESALGDGSPQSPHVRKTAQDNPSPSEQEYIINKLNSCMITGEEDFTAESLRRNWDLEEEYEDELTENLQSISKVIEEKRKTSLDNLISAKDEDITHYETLQPEGETDDHHDKEAEEKEEKHEGEIGEETDEEVLQAMSHALSSDQLDINSEANTLFQHTNQGKEDNEDLSLSFDGASPRISDSSRKRRNVRRSSKSSNKSQADEATNQVSTADSRMNGDFIIWSSGKMLNGDYTTEVYMGLYENNITHYIDSGKLLPLKRLTATTNATSSSSGFHHPTSNLFPDPFLASQSINELTGNILSTTSSLLNSSSNSSALVPSASTFGLHHGTIRGFYPIHVMECVIRPDIELKNFMSTIVKISKTLSLKCIPLQRSHIVITPGSQYQQQSTTAKIASMITSTLSATSTPSDSTQAVKEWDQVDIQIVISRELRQRVLLVQFLRRVPPQLFPSSALNGGNNTHSSSNPLASTNQALSTILTGTYEYVPLSRCPKTRKFISMFKAEIIEQKTSLSALYHAPLKTVCSLPNGFDIHFLAQLHSLCRELMWQKLILEYKEMEDHIEAQQKDAFNLLKILESMFKQYNMKVPDPWHRRRKRYLSRFNTQHHHPEQKSIKPDTTHNTDSTVVSTSATVNTSTQPVSVPSSPIAMISPTPERFIETNQGDESNNNNNGLMSPAESVRTLRSVNSSDRNSFNFHLQNRFIKDLLSSPKVDGMTFCLIMLDKCYYELQQRCDEDYTRKMQQRHELTLQYIEDIHEYKKELFYYLLDYKEYKTSKLFLAFKQTFTGVYIDEQLFILPTPSPPTSAASSTSSSTITTPSGNNNSNNNLKKSWFQGLTSSIQQITTTTSTPTTPSPATTSPPPNISLYAEVMTIDENHVILYYCSCLVNSTPGYFYLTHTHLLLSSSILGLNTKKEIYSLKSLKDIIVTTTGSNSATSTTSSLKDSLQSSASNLMNSNALKLVFPMKVLKGRRKSNKAKSTTTAKFFAEEEEEEENNGDDESERRVNRKMKEVLISPITIDCNKLKTIIMEVQTNLSDI